ncbi:unnamed protein product, partial [Ectocarpus sp. 12 AP-2014]
KDREREREREWKPLDSRKQLVSSLRFHPPVGAAARSLARCVHHPLISDFKKERRLDRFSSPQGSSRRAERRAGGWLLCYQRKARGKQHRCASSRKESSVPRCVCAYARAR